MNKPIKPMNETVPNNATLKMTPAIFDNERSQEIHNLLTKIAARQTPESVKNWLDHMEEMRKDKPLYGGEDN